MGSKPHPQLIGPVLSDLHGTLVDSVRMGFLHSSRTRGRIPVALNRAADVRYLGHSGGKDGSTLLRFEVPEFGSAAPDLFEQRQLWETGPKPNQTAFDLLAASLHDVRKMSKNSERYDHALLRRFSRYDRILKRGLESITLPDATIQETIDESLRHAAESLCRETPQAKRVRLSGRLDLLGVSKKLLCIILNDGTQIRAVWAADDFIDLATFLDKNVVIEGTAEFRPSGTLLRVDAEAIRKASPADSSFSNLPLPDIRRDYLQEASGSRSGKTAYAKVFGLIPGNESDEEFAAAVSLMS